MFDYVFFYKSMRFVWGKVFCLPGDRFLRVVCVLFAGLMCFVRVAMKMRAAMCFVCGGGSYLVDNVLSAGAYD